MEIEEINEELKKGIEEGDVIEISPGVFELTEQGRQRYLEHMKETLH